RPGEEGEEAARDGRPGESAEDASLALSARASRGAPHRRRAPGYRLLVRRRARQARPLRRAGLAGGRGISLLTSVVKYGRDAYAAAGMAMDDFLTYRVADAMTYRPRCVSPQASLAEARELFVTPGTDCVPVTEDGMLVGVLTSFDLLRAFVFTQPEGPPPYADVMRAPVRRGVSGTPGRRPPRRPPRARRHAP